MSVSNNSTKNEQDQGLTAKRSPAPKTSETVQRQVKYAVRRFEGTMGSSMISTFNTEQEAETFAKSLPRPPDSSWKNYYEITEEKEED